MFRKLWIGKYLFAKFQTVSVLFMFITPQDALEERVLLGREAHRRHRCRCSDPAAAAGSGRPRDPRPPRAPRQARPGPSGCRRRRPPEPVPERAPGGGRPARQTGRQTDGRAVHVVTEQAGDRGGAAKMAAAEGFPSRVTPLGTHAP